MAEDRARGIDVSHYQGSIDWKRVAEAGVSFAFIKATDGTGRIDPLFATNWKRSQAARLNRGAYHFFRAQQDSERQAQRFLAMMEHDPGELPPVLDFEILGNVQVEQAVHGAEQWMRIVEYALGKKPILYTGPSFFRTVLRDCEGFADHPLWIAHHTTAAHPSIPQPWNDWAFWQYSDKGIIPGVNGPVDLDCYAGNSMELNAFCGRIYQESAAIGS